MRSVSTVLGCVAVIALGSLGSVSPASADAPSGADLLVEAAPGPDQIVASSPETLDLTFGSDPGPVEVRVLDDAGTELAGGLATGVDRTRSFDLSGADADAGAVAAASGRVVAWLAPERDARGAYRYVVDPSGLGEIEVGRQTSTGTEATSIVLAVATAAAGLVALGLVRSGRPGAAAAAAAMGLGVAAFGAARVGSPPGASIAEWAQVSSFVDGVRAEPGWALAVVAALVAIGTGVVLGAPELDRQRTRPWRVVAPVVPVAGIVVGAVLAGVASFDRQAPPETEVLAGDDGWIELVVDPGRPGVNELHVYGFAADGTLAAFGDTSAWFVHPRTGVGPLEVPLLRAGPNHFLTYTATLPFDGAWQLVLDTETADGQDQTYRTEIEL